MYTTIAVPVDLQHIDRLPKALKTAIDLARHYGATLHFIGAATETPGPLHKTPQEYKAKLEAFAADQARQHGIKAAAKPIISLDLTVDLDRDLLQAIKEVGADLVVMASHVPGVREYLISSNAGWLASHGDMSVFIVR